MRNTRLALPAALVVVATGCLPDLQEISLQHDGRARTYQLFAPETLKGAEPAPLVVALHPFTGTGRSMAALTDFNAIAARENFVVAYPDGLNRSFNFSTLGVDDAGFILAVIDDVAARHAIDPDRVYLTGASNGGFMAYRMLCDHPEVFAAAAPVMATMPASMAETCVPANPVPLHIIHGIDDTVVPFNGSQIQPGPGDPIATLPVPDVVAFWVGVNGAATPPQMLQLPDTDPGDGTTATQDTYESAEAEVVLIAVEGGGHTWPGSPAFQPESLLGKTSHDFSASESIWDFFQSHSRP